MSSEDAGEMGEDNGEKSALVPRLRFPEFLETGEWITFELGNLSQLVTERVGTTACTPYTITTGIGLVSQEEKHGRTIAGNSLKNYIVLQKNDFAYNKSATKAYPQGFIACYAGEDRAAVPNSIFTCFRLDHNLVIPTFVDKLFSVNLHGRWLRNRIAVGARAHGSLQVNDDDLMAIPVPLPSGSRALVEQQKIADCLSSLDELITAETQKLDALKTHKKGLMQQLFPREGETVPRLRFPEFRDAGEWEVTTLGQTVDFQSGGTPSKENPAFWNGSIPWVSAKDMKQLLLDDAEDHITIIAVEGGAKLVPANTLLILTRGMTLLKDIPICILSRQMSFNQDVKALTAKCGVDARFLAYLMLGSKHRLLRLVDIAGHGTGRLDTDELKAFDLTLPQSSEQERIASCLAFLDDLITAQSQKIDVLKTHKKGLMQQLFPVLDEVPA